jgi:competence protein ComEC
MKEIPCKDILNCIKYENIRIFMFKHKFLILIILLLIILIRIAFSIYIFDYKYNEQEYNKNITLLVIKKEKVTETYISYLVKIKEKSNYTDKFILNIYLGKEITTDLDKDNFYINNGDFKYGDIVKVSSKITIPSNLHNLYEFDYKKYLNSIGIVGTIMTFDVKKDSTLNINILTYIYKYKESLERIIDSKLPIRESNLFKSMIYGNDENLDEDIKEKFTKLGLSHLLSVSGSNVGIILLILNLLFKKIKLNKFISFIITIMVVFVFCSISDFEVSVIRASIILIIALFTSLMSIRLNKYFSLIIAFILIIVYNPCNIFNVSFILSFTAFAGIIIFYKELNSLFYKYIVKIIGFTNIIKIRSNKSSKSLNFIYKLLKSSSNIISLYFSVQILIFPVQIYFFNSFTFISILSNLIIYIFSTIELILGFLFIILCNIPYISDILANLNYLTLWCIIKLVDTLMKFNLLEIKLPTPDYLSILCYYIFVILTFYGYKIKYILKYKFKSININLISKMIYILCMIYILYFNIYTTYYKSFVYYFNVEQGNMAIVKSGRKSILVDMGTTGKYDLTSILESFLKAYNIRKIDFFIVTHLHSDHVNGLFKLEEDLNNDKIEIRTVIFSVPKNEDNISVNSFTENSISYLEFENFLNRQKIKQIMVEQFDKIQINEDLVIDILCPKNKEIIVSKDKVNSNSIIAMISNKGSNYLFMGDSTVESEKVLLNDIFNLENKDVYLNKLKNIRGVQIGHHGSSTSTSEYFLKNINTKLAVISCKKSVYGHPSAAVVNILNKYNIRIHLTESRGGIMCY